MAIGVVRRDGTSTMLDAADVDGLQSAVRGSVQSGSGSQSTRPMWNALVRDCPALVVRCTGTADVAAAVRFAAERDLRIAVRGGGHSVAGLSTVDGGLVVDLGGMRGVQVDPERRLARVQGGALLGDVDAETQVFGLATPLGRVSETGVAGLTLGGGYGNLGSAFGLACDNLVDVQLVGADGVARTVSADREPDVFWALRGGGGGLGVATGFTFRLHPVGPLVGFAATLYPLDELADVQRRWRDLVRTVPDAITSCVVTMTFPAAPGLPEAVHDRPVAIVAAVHAGDVDMDALAPFRSLGTVLHDMSGPTPYTAVQTSFDPFFPRGALRAYWRSLYLDEMGDAAVDAVARLAADRPAPLTLVNTYHLGGAIHALDADATAFAERSAPFMVSVDTMWSDPADDARMLGWADDAWAALSPFGTGTTYANFAGRGVVPEGGRHAERLAGIRAGLDPAGLFAG